MFRPPSLIFDSSQPQPLEEVLSLDQPAITVTVDSDPTEFADGGIDDSSSCAPAQVSSRPGSYSVQAGPKWKLRPVQQLNLQVVDSPSNDVDQPSSPSLQPTDKRPTKQPTAESPKPKFIFQGGVAVLEGGDAEYDNEFSH